MNCLFACFHRPSVQFDHQQVDQQQAEQLSKISETSVERMDSGTQSAINPVTLSQSNLGTVPQTPEPNCASEPPVSNRNYLEICSSMPRHMRASDIDCSPTPRFNEAQLLKSQSMR